MLPSIDEQWEQHDDANTNVEALHQQIAALKHKAQKAEALEAYAAQEPADWGNFQASWQEAWQTKGSRGSKGRGAASSPYAKNHTGAKESEDHMG